MSAPPDDPSGSVGEPFTEQLSVASSMAPEIAVRDPQVCHLLANVLQVDDDSPIVQFLYVNEFLEDVEALFYLHPDSIRELTYLPVYPSGRIGDKAINLVPAHVTKLQSFIAWLEKIADQDPPDAVDWTECTADSFKLFRNRNMHLLETFLPTNARPSNPIAGGAPLPHRSSLPDFVQQQVQHQPR